MFGEQHSSKGRSSHFRMLRTETRTAKLKSCKQKTMKLQTSTKIWRKLETTICFLAWFLRNCVELRISGTEMLKKESNQKRRTLNALESENSWTTNYVPTRVQKSASTEQRTSPPMPGLPARPPLLAGSKKDRWFDMKTFMKLEKSMTLDRITITLMRRDLKKCQ